MSKKRKSFKSPKPVRSTSRSNSKNRYSQTAIGENFILAQLYSAKETVFLSEIHEKLLLNGLKKRDIKTAIDTMLQTGLIARDGKRCFKLGQKAQLYTGVLVQHPKGFGFLSESRPVNKSVPLKRDAFISPSQMGSAHHGDSVLIRVIRTRSDDRAEATVLKIVSRGTDRIAGIFMQERRGGLVYPDDPRYPFTIRVDENDKIKAKQGDAVIVQIERESRPGRTVSGKILNILGSADQIDTQMQMVIETFNLPHQFSDEVLQETENLVEPSSPEEFREDLRETYHVTIDGETAKDFDDAVCIIKNRKGFRLYVSIADVSHFVQSGSAIDREAYARGTSVYFPGRVIPMLPEKLSNNLCSLVPGEDRFTLTAILDFDRSGALLKKHFTRSVINSKQRFTYTTVKKILIDKDPAIRREHKPFLTQLKWAEELATALQNKRKKRGSINFNLPEPEFTLNEEGEVASIKKSERNFAHQLIEEFMLAANEAVAEFFTQRSIPAIYRVHDQPDQLKTEDFFAFTQTLGFNLPPIENNSAWYAQALDQCRDTKFEYIVNNLLIRSMKQAHYSATNVGHFGLASTDYTHFTSPIRRYPDLMVHRQLINIIQSLSTKTVKGPTAPTLKESGEFLSARERTAVLAERAMNDRLKISYMKERIGDSFDAVISGVNDSALFIDITDHCISGSIALDQLHDDYYIYDPKKYRLFGEMSARIYQIGDPLQVTLVNVDNYQKRLNFSPAMDND